MTWWTLGACFKSQLLKSFILISRWPRVVLSGSHPLGPVLPVVHLLIWLCGAAHMLCLFACVFSGCSAELTLSQPLVDHKWMFSFCGDIEVLRHDFLRFARVSTGSRCSDEFCQLTKFICDYRHNHCFSSTSFPSRRLRAGARLITASASVQATDLTALCCFVL